MMRPKTYLVGVAGALIGVVFFLAFLSYYGDISGFLWASKTEPDVVAHLEALIGPVVAIEGTGHDGRSFFLLANDPLLLDPETGLNLLWSPRYRAQRMLYPLVAGIGGLLAPTQILWGLARVNILALGISSWLSTGGLNLALGVLVLFCVLVVAASAILRPSLLSWSTAGFAPLLLVLNSAVTVGGLNITRALAPAVSAVLALVLGRKAFPARVRS